MADKYFNSSSDFQGHLDDLQPGQPADADDVREPLDDVNQALGDIAGTGGNGEPITPNIDGGTIDGAVIGSITPKNGDFTTLTADRLNVDRVLADADASIRLKYDAGKEGNILFQKGVNNDNVWKVWSHPTNNRFIVSRYYEGVFADWALSIGNDEVEDATVHIKGLEIDKVGKDKGAVLSIKSDEADGSKIEIHSENGLQWELSNATVNNNLGLARYANGVYQKDVLKFFGANDNLYINDTYNATPNTFRPIMGGGGPTLGTSGKPWGHLYLTNSSNISSDEAVKTDISDINPQMAYQFIKNVTPIRFKRIGGDSRWSMGWSAQRIAGNLTDFGIEASNFTMFNSAADEEGVLAPANIVPDEITAVMHSAMLRMMERIEALEAEVAALKAE